MIRGSNKPPCHIRYKWRFIFMKYIYPAVFTKDGDFYVVSFPDLDGCYTQGSTLQEAFEMASDILCLTLYNLEDSKAEIPAPSEIKNIKIGPFDFTSLVSCDTLEYSQFPINKQKEIICYEKNQYLFPAIFTQEEKGISINFPDLPGCLPCADTMEEAVKNAKEALGLHLYGMEKDGDVIP